MNMKKMFHLHLNAGLSDIFLRLKCKVKWRFGKRHTILFIFIQENFLLNATLHISIFEKNNNFLWTILSLFCVP